MHRAGTRFCIVSLLGLLVAPCFGADQVFVECAAEIGIIAEHDPGIGLVAGPLAMPAAMIAGGAVGDFNNDGWQDVFVVTSGGSPDYLFMNNGDGTFADVAAQWDVAVTHMGLGACVGDYDGDGWLDIFVTSLGTGTIPLPGKHRLYHNLGGTGFEEVAAAAGVQEASPVAPDGFGSTFGDFDLDGDLDLFVCSWNFNALGNRLFVNNGDGTFVDGTEAAGIEADAVRGFSPRFVDMNGDRYPELLIAADFETSRYFINDTDGTFTESTAASGTGLDGNGMGHTVGDFDANGMLDWYVTSIHSLNSGNPEVPGTGNMLYMNQGANVFVETSESAGVKDGGWGWGTVAVDIDHDGRLDLVETNGWPAPNGNGDYEWLDEQSYAFRNLGNGEFEDISAASGIDHHDLLGRSLVIFDFDNDGDQDLLIFSHDAEVRVYRNDLTGPDVHWLRVILDTSESPDLAPHGAGAHLFADVDGVTLHRYLDTGCTYLGQSELSVHFGLGSALQIDSLRIEWTNGSETTLFDLPVDQTVTIPAGLPEFRRGDCDADGDQGLQDAIFALQNLFGGGDETWPCLAACDSNDDDHLGLVDPIYLLNGLFGSGASPPSPFGDCGADASLATSLGCESFPPCQ